MRANRMHATASHTTIAMTYRLLSDSATGGTLPGGVADVRGWPVRDDAGRLLGAVLDAVFDDAAQTRFLVVDLHRQGGDGAGDRPRGGATRILLPIALGRVGAPAGEVTVPGVSAGDLARLTEFRGDVAAAVAAYERRAGAELVDTLSDPNALGGTRSSDPDVRAERLAGRDAPPPV
jgi:hypothetical protein